MISLAKLWEYIRFLAAPKWKPVKLGWPYGVGYGTYRPGNWAWSPTVFHSGLTKEEAKEICHELNVYQRQRVKEFWRKK